MNIKLHKWVRLCCDRHLRIIPYVYLAILSPTIVFLACMVKAAETFNEAILDLRDVFYQIHYHGR